MALFRHGAFIVNDNGSFAWNTFGSDDMGVLEGDHASWEDAFRLLGEGGWELVTVHRNEASVSYFFKMTVDFGALRSR